MAVLWAGTCLRSKIGSQTAPVRVVRPKSRDRLWLRQQADEAGGRFGLQRKLGVRTVTAPAIAAGKAFVRPAFGGREHFAFTLNGLEALHLHDRFCAG